MTITKAQALGIEVGTEVRIVSGYGTDESYEYGDHRFPVGTVVTLRHDDGTDRLQFTDGEMWQWVSLKQVTLIEEDDAEKTPAEAAGFVEGTAGIITGNSIGHEFRIGQRVQLKEDDNSNAPLFEGEDGSTWYVYLSEIQRVNLSPLEEAGYAVNDIVYVTNSDYDTFGKVCRIARDDGDRYPRLEALDGSDFDCVGLDSFRKATEGEISMPHLTPLQRAGFNVGDIVRVTAEGKDTSGMLCRIERDYANEYPMLKAYDDSEWYYVRIGGFVKAEPEENLTKAQRAGWSVGSLGLVLEEDGSFEQGSVIRLEQDDGSDCPCFESLDGDITGYMYLGVDVALLQRADGAPVVVEPKKTPAQVLGWELGDYGVVNRSTSSLNQGDIVRFKYDDASDCPQFDVIASTREITHRTRYLPLSNVTLVKNASK